MAEQIERADERYAAGAAVPHTGIYRVYHYAHRLPHAVMILRGNVFPACNCCGDKVEFAALLDAELADRDYDFLPLADTRLIA